MTSTTLKALLATLPQVGEVVWIGLRPARRQTMEAPDHATLAVGQGLVGDRYQGRGDRDVTLIQAEHLQLLASLLGRESPVMPDMLRRNIVVRGINLLALKHCRFQLGEAELVATGLCHPCSRMEEILGPGGYNAMRGHGGITARVETGGVVKLGDRVAMLAPPD